MQKSQIDIEDTVKNSQSLMIVSNSVGDTIITGKNGEEARAIAGGKFFEARQFVVNGVKVYCMLLSDVARAAHEVTAGTTVRLQFLDSESNSGQIVPKANYAISEGDFMDEETQLSFQNGKTKVLFGSNRCDEALVANSSQEVVDGGEAPKPKPLEEDVGAGATTSKRNGLFGRGLLRGQQAVVPSSLSQFRSTREFNRQQPPAPATNPFAQVRVMSSTGHDHDKKKETNADIAKRKHDKYMSFRVAHQAGHRILTDNESAEICSGNGCSGSGSASASAAPSSSPSESPTTRPTLSPILSLCTIAEGYSDGSAGDLVTDENGQLTLGGVPLTSQYSATSGTIGTAFGATTTFDNVDNFIIPEGVTVNVLGTVTVRAKQITIEGTLDGTEGGYPGGASVSTSIYGYAPFGSSPPDSNGEGGGGTYASAGGGGAGHGKYIYSIVPCC